jgi:hypothetical protein
MKAQFLAVEQRHGLARVEDEGNALLGEFARVLDHAFAAVRGDDAEGDARRPSRGFVLRIIAPGWKAVIWLLSCRW